MVVAQQIRRAAGVGVGAAAADVRQSACEAAQAGAGTHCPTESPGRGVPYASTITVAEALTDGGAARVAVATLLHAVASKIAAG